MNLVQNPFQYWACLRPVTDITRQNDSVGSVQEVVAMFIMTLWGGLEVQLHSLLNLAPDGVGWSASRAG